MPSKTVELRPDRRKLKPTFDGYKLNLEPLPILRYNILSPERVETSDKQFSFLHAELFGLHNHLIRDPWHPNSAYFLDTTWTLQKVCYDPESGKVRPISPVMKVLRPKSECERYPISLEFVSENLALLGDGYGTLIIVETGNRENSDEFKAKQRFNVLEEGEAFSIRAAAFNAEEKTIHVVLLQIRQSEDHFDNHVHWVKLRCCEGIWSILDRKILKTRSNLFYCGLDVIKEGLIVATDYPIDFQSNLEKSKEKSSEELEKDEIESMEKDIPGGFSWSQTEEDLTINFDPQESSLKQDYEVKVTSKDEISVKYKGKSLLESKIFGQIDMDMTTWTLQNESLQIMLMKDACSQVKWPFLIPGGPEEQKETNNQVQSAAYASSMEECDFGLNDQDRENYLSRLEWKTEETSHQVYLGGHAPLFEVQSGPIGWPKAVGLKHDVDACIWQYRMDAQTAFTMTHEDTIDAFGYVLASKQQKKFVGCAPNAGYVAIAEAERHIFIYKKGYQGSNLRNRTGIPVNIGQQKLVTLEGMGEIIGISVENDIILLLTTQNLLCIQLKIEE